MKILITAREYPLRGLPKKGTRWDCPVACYGDPKGLLRCESASSSARNKIQRSSPLGLRSLLRKYFAIVISIAVIIFQFGCSYPKLQRHKLNELTFSDKRLEGKIRDIGDFIRPEETKGVLEELAFQEYSTYREENIVLNILNYSQKLKQRRDKKEFWQYPGETIEKGGDCEDKTFLLLSMLIQSRISGAFGVKGRYLGGGHMWVEYNGYILDPSRRKALLIPVNKSLGYIPHFKFDQHSSYFCEIEGR